MPRRFVCRPDSFCYNNIKRMNKKAVFSVLLISLFWTSTFLMAFEPDDEIDNLILRIEDAFNNKNVDGFSGFFHENIREVEKAKITSKIEDFQMERISIHKVLSQSIDENTINLNLRVKYEDMRGDSNDKLKAGQRGIHIMIVNRVISGIHAARLAYKHNKRLESDLSSLQINIVEKHIIDNKVPMLMITKQF